MRALEPGGDMLYTRPVAATPLLFVAAVVCGSCSKLTDPTYEFITLRAIDGQPLPAYVKFGPDSGAVPVRSGRLGFSNASLGLPCRLEIKVGLADEREGRGSIGEHPRCHTGGGDPFVAEGTMSYVVGNCDFKGGAGNCDFLSSGKHQLSFSGLIRTKSPDF